MAKRERVWHRCGPERAPRASHASRPLTPSTLIPALLLLLVINHPTQAKATDLPEDIVLYILSLLPSIRDRCSAAATCRSWAAAARAPDPGVWGHAVLRSPMIFTYLHIWGADG